MKIDKDITLWNNHRTVTEIACVWQRKLLRRIKQQKLSFYDTTAADSVLKCTGKPCLHCLLSSLPVLAHNLLTLFYFHFVFATSDTQNSASACHFLGIFLWSHTHT